MKCEKCSTDLPNEAVACYRCGTVTDVTFVRPTLQLPATEKAGIGTGTVVVIVASVAIAVAAVTLLIGFIVFSDNSGQKDQQNQLVKVQPAQTPQPRSTPTPQIETAPPTPKRTPDTMPQPDEPESPADTGILFDGAIDAPANNIGWKAFTLKRAGRVTGRLEGVGGIKGEFEWFIMDDQALTDYRNGKKASTLYQSEGKVVVAQISAKLPGGLYYIVIRNASPWTHRRVTGKIIAN